MADQTVTMVSAADALTGDEGEKCLASGKSMAMRMWVDEQPGTKPPSRRDYETVGYVLSGSARLHLEGHQTVELNQGDSYVVPREVTHHYEMLTVFTSVEATHPPAKCPL